MTRLYNAYPSGPDTMQSTAAVTMGEANAPGESPWIELDWSKFERSTIQPVRHRFAGHPLFQLGELAKLGKRLEAEGRVRTHTNATTAGTPFNDAPKLHPNTRSAEETLTGIQSASAWMSLLNVQSDELYRTLVDQAMGSVKPRLDQVDPGLSYRGGWIFVSSPHTVTPFHMDTENGFILQIQGRKRVYVWDNSDTVVVSERGRELFHAAHSRDLVLWKEEFRSRAHVFDLEPGMGAYMPVTSPHLVENGPEPSVTVSFTYYTDYTRRRARLYRSYAALRKLGITPPAAGSHPSFDAALAALMRGKDDLRRLLRRSSPPPTTSRYAIPRYS